MKRTPVPTFESRIADAWPTASWRDAHVVLAVSSGPDSVAMLRAILAVTASCAGSGRVFAAHLNHGLRRADADADQAWLEALCRRLDVPLDVARVDISALAAEQGDGLEAAARLARYDFLCRTAEKVGARFVAVAHTADDQIETVLHRILRGTGLAGLAGMPATRPLSPSVLLVRPLLAVSRSDVLNYLEAIDQDFRIDPTNEDTHFTRNRIRHDLLPLLRKQYNVGVSEALLRLAAQAGESQHVITTLAERLSTECAAVRSTTPGLPGSQSAVIEIDCSRLKASPPLLIREMCRILWQQANWPMQAMGYDAWQSFAELIQGLRTEPVMLPGNIRAHRVADTVVIESPS